MPATTEKKSPRSKRAKIWVIMDNLNSHYASALSFDYNLQIVECAMYADIIRV